MRKFGKINSNMYRTITKANNPLAIKLIINKLIPVGSFFDKAKYASGLNNNEMIWTNANENLDLSELIIFNIYLF